jgi:tetratricopeptide (TPR) repeat protein
MRRENAYWVQIEGFDEFMADLHEGLGLQLPDLLRDPYAATTAGLNRFIAPKGPIQHPIIKKHMAQLERQVKNFEHTISSTRPARDARQKLIPNLFLAQREYDRYNYRDAVRYFLKAVQQNPNDRDSMQGLASAYSRLGKPAQALRIARHLMKLDPQNDYYVSLAAQALHRLGKHKDSIKMWSLALKSAEPESPEWIDLLNGRSNQWLITGKWKEALNDTEMVILSDGGYKKSVAANNISIVMNYCLALKGLNRTDEARDIAQYVLSHVKADDPFHRYLRASAYGVLGKETNMLEELKHAINENNSLRLDAQLDPDFADYRSDPKFQRLVHRTSDKSERRM